MNNSFETMQEQIATLSAAIQEQNTSLSVNERQKLLAASRALVQQIETPKEKIVRMMWHEPLVLTSTRVLIDLGVFKLLSQTTEPQNSAQLHESTGAEQSLLERLLKHVATEKYVTETEADTYVANDITRTLATAEGEGCVVDMFKILKVYHRLPDFLRETNYASPRDKDASPFKFAYETELHYFDWLTAHPEEMPAFNGHMEFKNLGLQWFEEPAIVESALGAGVGDGEVLIVDVGGNAGYQLKDFRQAHPQVPGRLVLQDLPDTIDGIDKKGLGDAGVEAIGHDFFDTQVVKGAKVYYLKMVLHDWPDKQCIEILQQLLPALKPGYSKVLINEIVVPDQNAQWFQTSIDMLMLSCHAAQERREREWRALIEQAGGLKMNKIWDVAGAMEKVIEVEAV